MNKQSRMTAEEFAEYSKNDPYIIYIRSEMPKLRAKAADFLGKPFEAVDVLNTETAAAIIAGKNLKNMQRALVRYRRIIVHWCEGRKILVNGSAMEATTLPNGQKGFVASDGLYWCIKIDALAGIAEFYPGELYLE
jgi:hypothetical protein